MTTMTSALFLYWRTKRVQWALRCTNTINFLSLSFATTMMIMIQMDPPSSWWHQNLCLNQYWIEIWRNLWMHFYYDANNDKSRLQGVKRYLQNSPDKPWPVKAFKGQIVSLTFCFKCPAKAMLWPTLSSIWSLIIILVLIFNGHPLSSLLRALETKPRSLVLLLLLWSIMFVNFCFF